MTDRSPELVRPRTRHTQAVGEPLTRLFLRLSGQKSTNPPAFPGGKPEEGESWEDTAVRELTEETGLRAEPSDARVLAFLTDTAHGVTRVAAAVRVRRHTGTPEVREPRHVHRWEWHERDDLRTLAQPLFTPSAQVLESVWPGLLPGLPPVDRRRIAPGNG